ncbi:MAG TPA: hypothetical protein VLS95_10000, partial [Arthrobacter sp.]|nr:hypothetical protein [Arthrobacter sp.]
GNRFTGPQRVLPRGRLTAGRAPQRRGWMSRRDPTARVDVEVWQLQARLGRNPATDLNTFEVVHGAARGRVRPAS